jgi:hypothetical protein
MQEELQHMFHKSCHPPHTNARPLQAVVLSTVKTFLHLTMSMTATHQQVSCAMHKDAHELAVWNQ